MLRIVKFPLDTKDYCLTLNPICEDEEWDLVFYSDSYWAGAIQKQESECLVLSSTCLASQFVGD
jgi:hypothetical protein